MIIIKQFQNRLDNFTHKYNIDKTNLLSDTKVVIFICIVFDLLIFGLLNLLLGIITNKLNFNLLYFFIPRLNFSPIYFIMFIILIVINLIIAYKFKQSFKSLNINQKGSSRFTTFDEIKSQYKPIPEYGTFVGRGGIIISRTNDKIYIDDSPTNNLIIGTTRSLKTETLVIPMVDIYSRAQLQASLIINDPKGEIASASYNVLKSRGYDVFLINSTDPAFSHSFNPLEEIKNAYKSGDIDSAQSLTNSLTHIIFNDTHSKDKFWHQSASSLTNAIILAHVIDCVKSNQQEKINLYSVCNFLNELGSKEIILNPFTNEKHNALDSFFKARELGDIAKLEYATSDFAKGQARGGIYSTASNGLRTFIKSGFAKMTSTNDINLENIGFGEKPVAVFLTTPDFDTSAHFLSTIFVKQLYFMLARKCTKVDGGCCKREVVFLLDEFGNMPSIPDMDVISTVCLGRKIKFNLIVQDYEQLKTRYPNGYRTILGNCGNQIYLLSASNDTAEIFSKLIGYQTLKVYTRSGKFLSLDKSMNESFEKRALIDPNELMHLKCGETVISRVTKRKDLNDRDITSYPIFNKGKNKFKPRYEYLSHIFDTSKSIYHIDLNSNHKNINLKNYIYFPDIDIAKEVNLLNEQNIDKNTSSISLNTTSSDCFLSELLSEQKLKIMFSKLKLDVTDMYLSDFYNHLYNLLQAQKLTSDQYTTTIEFLKKKSTSTPESEE